MNKGIINSSPTCLLFRFVPCHRHILRGCFLLAVKIWDLAVSWCWCEITAGERIGLRVSDENWCRFGCDSYKKLVWLQLMYSCVFIEQSGSLQRWLVFSLQCAFYWVQYCVAFEQLLNKLGVLSLQEPSGLYLFDFPFQLFLLGDFAV